MRLTVTFGNPQLNIALGEQKLSASTGTPIARDYSDVPIYDGEYVVIPMAYEEQTLQTRAKLLTQNVKVTEIPYYEVENLSGGYTVNIG